MDLAWAVDDDGTPVYLDSVRYVRVYTGVQQMNGIMGESSTEILGSHRATLKGTGAAAAPTIKLNNSSLNEIAEDYEDVVIDNRMVSGSSNQRIITISGLTDFGTTFNLNVEGGTYVYMNGVNTSSTGVTLGEGTTMVQVISQSGTGDAFITLVQLSK